MANNMLKSTFIHVKIYQGSFACFNEKKIYYTILRREVVNIYIDIGI
jgi:hypothetical protein